MNEQDQVVAVLTGFSIDKILNTVDLIEAIVGRNGIRHGDKIAMQFCKDHNLPRMGTMELMACLGKAANRKMLLEDPNQDTNSLPSIIQ